MISYEGKFSQYYGSVENSFYHNWDLRDYPFDEQKIVNKIKKYLKKYSLKDTVTLILETEKINKKHVYDLCLKIKNEKNN